jgi:disulfide bond formation protein DsbB
MLLLGFILLLIFLANNSGIAVRIAIVIIIILGHF